MKQLITQLKENLNKYNENNKIIKKVNYIYLFTNKTNDKKYVGISKQPLRRLREHCKADSKIGQALQDDGYNNFTIEIIGHRFRNGHALKEESNHIIKKRTLWPYGYNANYDFGVINMKLYRQNRDMIDSFRQFRKGII